MSKIITVTLGTPGTRITREGWLILSHADPAGGRTSIGTKIERRRWIEETEAGKAEKVGPFPLWENIAADLNTQIGAQPSWPKFVKAKVEGNTVRLSVPDELNPVTFFAEFNPSLTQAAPHELNPPEVTIREETF